VDTDPKDIHILLKPFLKIIAQASNRTSAVRFMFSFGFDDIYLMNHWKQTYAI